MKVTIEKVDKLVERADVSYEVAKEALESVNGDMLDAVILLEREGRLGPNAGNKKVTTYTTGNRMPTVIGQAYGVNGSAAPIPGNALQTRVEPNFTTGGAGSGQQAGDADGGQQAGNTYGGQQAGDTDGVQPGGNTDGGQPGGQQGGDTDGGQPGGQQAGNTYGGQPDGQQAGNTYGGQQGGYTYGGQYGQPGGYTYGGQQGGYTYGGQYGQPGGYTYGGQQGGYSYNRQGGYAYGGQPGGNAYGRQTGAQQSGPHRYKDESAQAEENIKKFFRWIGRVIRGGCINYFDVWRKGERVLYFPVILFLFCLIPWVFWIFLAFIVIGLFCGCRYRFSGPHLGKESVNDAMDKVSDMAEDMKRDENPNEDGNGEETKK